MGLSASQARLLNLTARMHDIEYKAQNLEAQKLQMANESRHVYQEYEDALNKQKVQFKKMDPSGAFIYEDASLQTLLNNGYRIKLLNNNQWYEYDKYSINADGKLSNTEWKSDATYQIDEVTAFSHSLLFNAEAGDVLELNITPSLIGSNGSNVVHPSNNNNKFLLKVTSVTPNETGTKKQFTYEILISHGDSVFEDLDLSDNETLRNLVEAGFIVFEKPMPDGTYSEVNIATDTNLQEVSDEILLKKAEAKYEADMRRINNKDKKFDTDLAALDNERTAIKAEMETLKSVAKENVDRTFKLFS